MDIKDPALILAAIDAGGIGYLIWQDKLNKERIAMLESQNEKLLRGLTDLNMMVAKLQNEKNQSEEAIKFISNQPKKIKKEIDSDLKKFNQKLLAMEDRVEELVENSDLSSSRSVSRSSKSNRDHSKSRPMTKNYHEQDSFRDKPVKRDDKEKRNRASSDEENDDDLSSIVSQMRKKT